MTVKLRVWRSAVTGEWVDRAYSESHPQTTVCETVLVEDGTAHPAGDKAEIVAGHSDPGSAG